MTTNYKVVPLICWSACESANILYRIVITINAVKIYSNLSNNSRLFTPCIHFIGKSIYLENHIRLFLSHDCIQVLIFCRIFVYIYSLDYSIHMYTRCCQCWHVQRCWNMNFVRWGPFWHPSSFSCYDRNGMTANSVFIATGKFTNKIFIGICQKNNEFPFGVSYFYWKVRWGRPKIFDLNLSVTLFFF